MLSQVLVCPQYIPGGTEHLRDMIGVSSGPETEQSCLVFHLSDAPHNKLDNEMQLFLPFCLLCDLCQPRRIS